MTENFITRWLDGESSKSKLYVPSIITAAVILGGCAPTTEQAPVQEEEFKKASFSGIIDRSTAPEVGGNIQPLLEKELDSINEKFGEKPGYISGSEMSYWITEEGGDTTAYHMAAFKEDNGQNGIRVLEYCNLSKDTCMSEINRPLLTITDPAGTTYIRYMDENGKEIPIATYYKDGSTFLIGPGNDIFEQIGDDNERLNLLEAIANLGAKPVSANPGETETPTEVLPTQTETVIPTETEAPTPESTPTEEKIEYKNWGNAPMTLEREDIEKNGLIIPFNPIDNKEEFENYLKEMIREKGRLKTLGKMAFDFDAPVPPGIDPVHDFLMGPVKIVDKFQILFFEYNGTYYPFVSVSEKDFIYRDSPITLVGSTFYDDFIKMNEEGNELTAMVYYDIDKVASLVERGKISTDEADIARRAKTSVFKLMALN